MTGLPQISIELAEANMPRPDNDNWGLATIWRTPAEVLQWIRQDRQQLSRQLIAEPRLWTCPEHRLTRAINLAMEKCALWHHYGVR